MNKLNFDLKLEIFHREQQAAAQEKKLERMQELENQVQQMGILEDELQELRGAEEDNQRLRQSNEVLRLEIDKRDQAVDEAVDLICQLESKLEELEARSGASTDIPSQPNKSDMSTSPEPWPEALTPRGQTIVDVPDRTSSRKGTRSNSYNMLSRSSTPTLTSRRPRHTPSFLREQSSTTSMLRNVYLTDPNKSRTALSVVSKTETIRSGDGTYMPDSPRLSILSECSYLDDALDVLLPESGVQDAPSRDDEIGLSPISDTRTRGLSRIEQWIQPHPNLFNDNAQAPFRPSARNSDPTASKRPSLGAAFEARRSVQSSKPGTTTAVTENIFDGGRLPPTPDTMSTAYIDMKDKPRGNIVAERSRYIHPQSRGLEPTNTILGRRQSADDITTRPSTADTVLIDRTEAWDNASQYRLNIDGDYPLASMFPQFDFSRRRSSQVFDVESLVGIAEPISMDKGGLVPQDGKPLIPAATPTKPQSKSDSPPLTPQDWLDAALPAEAVSSGKTTTTGKQFKRSPATADHIVKSDSCLEMNQVELGETPTKLNECDESEDQLPPASSLRVRVSNRDSRPPVDPQPQSRRRLSLRPPFFNRSSNKQPTMSDSLESGRITPTFNIKNKRLSSLSQYENSDITPRSVEETVKEASTPNTNTPNSISRSASQFGSISTEAGTARPCTSGSPEHKRRSSHGFFSWMKSSVGAGSTPSSARTTAVVTPTPGETNTTRSTPIGNLKVGSNQPATRPVSALALTSPDVPSSPLGPNSASILEESPNMDTRSRFPYRRNRRA